MSTRTNRREFLRRTTTAGIGFWVAGRIARAESKSPNEKLNIACIGVGGRGKDNTGGMANENIVALCDVDEVRAAESFKRFTALGRGRDAGQHAPGITPGTPFPCL